MSLMFSKQHTAPAQPVLGPKLIFSYGMTKSGSTFAFEIARTGLELSGFAQPKLCAPALHPQSKINFINHLDQAGLDAIWDEMRSIGHPIALKTHQRPDLPVIDLIDQGRAVVQATYRDPRDVALSMLDHAERARKDGRSAFADIRDLADAHRELIGQIDSLTQWLVRPYVLPIYFDDLIGKSEHVAKLILGQIGLTICAKKVVSHVMAKRFIQFNKGQTKRFKHEMSLDDQRHFRKSFAPLYQRIIRARSSLIADGRPALPDGTILFNTDYLT